MTIWSFASEPPARTPIDACPPGALESDTAQGLLASVSGKMAEAIDGDADAYRRAVETCDCPDWGEELTFGDIEVIREICNLSLTLVRGRLGTVDSWVQTELDAQDALKGSVR